ncbi:MAG: hypothetical protein QG640_279 [Patescibacteria group bacterium]|nr:hypothetical protein [Patescibacteria group bacterium]
MNENKSSSTGPVIAVLVFVVILIVAWVAYSQGFFQAKEEVKDEAGFQINLGGSSGAERE